MAMHEVRHIGVSIQRAPKQVYEFIARPENLPLHNAIRVVRNGSGSEVVFTLLRRADASDAAFAADAQWVEKDLRLLKGVLEQ